MGSFPSLHTPQTRHFVPNQYGTSAPRLSYGGLSGETHYSDTQGEQYNVSTGTYAATQGILASMCPQQDSIIQYQHLLEPKPQFAGRRYAEPDNFLTNGSVQIPLISASMHRPATTSTENISSLGMSSGPSNHSVRQLPPPPVSQRSYLSQPIIDELPQVRVPSHPVYTTAEYDMRDTRQTPAWAERPGLAPTVSESVAAEAMPLQYQAASLPPTRQEHSTLGYAPVNSSPEPSPEDPPSLSFSTITTSSPTSMCPHPILSSCGVADSEAMPARANPATDLHLLTDSVRASDRIIPEEYSVHSSCHSPLVHGQCYPTATGLRSARLASLENLHNNTSNSSIPRRGSFRYTDSSGRPEY